jgi:hypothetical protein
MTAAEIIEELRPLGLDTYRKVLVNHGVREPMFGVKIEELKKIQKRVKKDYQLALDLYCTGIYDAQYLAGLIADDPKMTREDLQLWVENANCNSIGVFTVAWVASEGRHGWELALRWIESGTETIAATGWSTLSSLVGIRDDSELDLAELRNLLDRVRTTIHQQPNRVRSVMNGFVIAVGSYVGALTDEALKVAADMGSVFVDNGATACKTPDAAEYIRKLQARGTIGKKRKTAKC